MADHTPGGELKAVGKISLTALADIQKGEERSFDIPETVAYVHLPAMMNGVPDEVGVDIIGVTVKRPAK